ncbi:MAG: hypothetical protein LQ352_003475 [Teloschistes flavicans]|nr:MAG: hypothetical protein LQ352_003475 [Teloschistes flavicans]
MTTSQSSDGAIGALVSSISRDNDAYYQSKGIRRSAAAEAEATYRNTDLERQIFRRFRAGDVYAPHDLSSSEQHKWRQRRFTMPGIDAQSSTSSSQKGGKRQDVFDVLGIHPLDEFKNPNMMFEYVSSMGRLRHRRETGLRGVNQRRISKAVRRAVGMGFLPSVHKHPEMLEKEAEQNWAKMSNTSGLGAIRYNRGSRGQRPRG